MGPAQAPGSPSAGAPRAAILVVDDDGDIRLALEMLLAYEGFEVWTAKDGEEAEKRLEAEQKKGRRPAAVLKDLKMPRLDGLRLLERLQARPDELIESELFGHEKGSFTGAVERRIGHFEAADGGPLFLDEVGDMPLAAQAKVLRALETHEITRVGESRTVPVDIRVIAATNADLTKA